MLLIYYNYNYNFFYVIYKKFYDYEKYVGFKNSYNHEIVQILIFHKNELYNISNSTDYHDVLYLERRKKRNTIRKRIISFLNKLLEE